MKSAIKIGLLVGLMGLVTPCHAGPPYNIDDPGTTEFRRFNLILAYLSSQNASGESQSFPNLALSYGYSNTLELDLTLTGTSFRAAGSPHIGGFGDIAAGVRWRFLEETKHRPQLALGYQIKLPTADVNRGLGSGATDHTLWLTGAKTYGRWVAFSNVGYNFLAGNTGTSNLFWGVGLTYQVSETLIVGGQVYGNSSSAIGARSEFAWGFGATYNFAPDRSFLLSLGRSEHGFSDLNVYAGLSFTFGK